MAKLNDLDDVNIVNPRAGDVVKYTAAGWTNGADAVSGGPGGNACGDLSDYTKYNRKETIIEPWIFDLDKDTVGPLTEDVITVKDEEGNIGYFGPRRTRNANAQGFVKMQIKDDGQGLIQAQNTLSFVDSQNPNGVTLAELAACCDGSGGGNINRGNTFFSAKFKFDGTEAPFSQSFDKWDQTPGLAEDKRYLNWKTSDPLEVTLPDWATGAVVIYIQNHRWEFSENIANHPMFGTGTPAAFRQYTAHRVAIENAEFAVGTGTNSSGDPNKLMVNILNSNIFCGVDDSTIQEGNRTTYQETTNYQFLRLTGSSKTVTFTQTVDLIRGGWNKVTCGTGKMIIVPIVFNPADVFSVGEQQDFNAFVTSDDDGYQELLDLYYPPYTEESLILEDTRTLKEGIINALNVCNDALAQDPGNATIEGIRSNLYALKDETTLAFAEARFKVLIGELRTALAWKFDWEPAGYSLV